MSFARHSPFETTPQDRLMGAFLVVAILIAVYSVAQGGFLGNMAESRLTVETYFRQSYGINPGAEVKLSGILIGRVAEVSLEDRERVRVQAIMDPAYRKFYKQGSRLKVNSELGLDSVITGTGLEFVPGDGEERLRDGALLEAEEPRSMQDLLQEWNVKELAAKAEKIIDDLTQITASLVANQSQLVSTLNNVEQLTGSTVQLVDSLPPVVAHVDSLVVQLSDTMNAINAKSDVTAQQVTTLLQNSNELTIELQGLLENMQPAVTSVPGALADLRRLSRQSSRLVTKISNHWLLGGGAETVVLDSAVSYSGDDSLYKKSEALPQ